MITQIEVYKLEVMAGNPIYEGFALGELPSFLGRECLYDDMKPGFGASRTIREWQQPKLKDCWHAPKVEGRVAAFNDYPGINMLLPAFSQRACKALADFLEPNGELLSIASPKGNYYFFNIQTIVPALNVENSVCDFAITPIRALSIDYFSFHQELLMNLSIFRIYEWPTAILVTNKFVEKVHESGLNGFQFKKVWPLPIGSRWQVYNKKPYDSHKLKKHTLVIALILSKNKPTANENKQIKKIENELDSLLSVSNINDFYFGSYEGHDLVEGEYRMFVNCPNVDLLEKKVFTWMSNLEWSGKFRAIKRYGKMNEINAVEIISQFDLGDLN